MRINPALARGKSAGRKPDLIRRLPDRGQAERRLPGTLISPSVDEMFERSILRWSWAFFSRDQSNLRPLFSQGYSRSRYRT